MKDLNSILNQLKDQLGLNQIQIGPLATPLTIEFYEKWLTQDFHADMAYLKEHLSLKKSPQLLHPKDLKSVITITQPYFPIVNATTNPIPARAATYAQNQDYHFWLKEKLTHIIEALKQQHPEHEFLPFVDSGPVLERNWAFENGLGWFGKNTCLIHPQFGSLFFIAEILTTLEPPPQKIEKVPDFCGNCQKCITICPTGALIAPKTLKAELCISYLTIESKSIHAIELREKMGDWFFGCDLCQTTCPWNEKVFRTLKLAPSSESDTRLQLELSPEKTQELILFFRNLLTSSNKKIAKEFQGSPLSRAGGNGLKRNALIVIANRKLRELRPEVELHLENPRFSELASWCLQALN